MLSKIDKYKFMIGYFFLTALLPIIFILTFVAKIEAEPKVSVGANLWTFIILGLAMFVSLKVCGIFLKELKRLRAFLFTLFIACLMFAVLLLMQAMATWLADNIKVVERLLGGIVACYVGGAICLALDWYTNKKVGA